MTLNLYVAATEVAYLNADFDRMEQMAAVVLQEARTIFDKVKIYETQIAAQTAQSQVLEAIATGREALLQLGVVFPIDADAAQVDKALQDLTTQLQGKEIAALVDLPVMSDPTAQAAMQLLGTLYAPVFFGHPSLMPLLSATMVGLSLQFGNAPASTVGYVIHGMAMCAFLAKVETGYSFGRLALNVLDRIDARAFKPMTLHLFGLDIQHRQEVLRATVLPLKESYIAGMETGDFLYASYSIAGCSYMSLFAGVELDNWETEFAPYNAALTQIKQYSPRDYLDMTWQVVKNLREIVSQPDRLLGTAYDETVMLPKHQRDNEFSAIGHVYIYKLLLAYLFGDYQAALDHITQTKPYLMGVSGLIFVPIFHFYAALTQLALLLTQPETERAEMLFCIKAHQTILQQWAQHAPMNYLHKWCLVEAERYRVSGEKVAATECYDKAISLAKANEYIQEEALANELAARFYLDWGKERIAREYMIEAYYGYGRWGAKAKVADLETRYPQLLASILQQTRTALSVNETVFPTGTVTSTISSSSSKSVCDSLDLAAILKAFQTISGEIELEKLLSSLLIILIENAGANKCVLMLVRDEGLLIKGSIIQGSKPVVLQHLPIEDSQDIPHKLIYKVLHNRQTVVLLDASAERTLANDPYIIRQQPHSILCSPILHQGKLLGILYLENNLATGAFTSDRVELLNLLCAQAAISLENAHLYEQAQQMLAELSASEARFQKLADNLPGVIYQFCLALDGSVSIPYVSPGCVALYEVPAEEFLTGITDFRMLEHPDDYLAITQALIHSAETLTPFEHEWRIITTSGTVKWVQAASRPERQADGSTVWDGVLIDISDRKIAELALQQAQLQMIQSEKMSALGNLVAGVAHEMNNPLAFISASLQQTKPTITDLTEHLKLYQETFPNNSEEIKDHAAEIDLEYSIEDLSKVVDSMTMACNRLKNISTSLRTFSRADKDYKVPFQIHEGIDSTILILKHRLKANEQRPAIEVVTNYGNLSVIECFPGQLNQVFMNILANAIDALDESNIGRNFEEIKAHPNCITIITSVENNLVKIAIADNGKGMNESVKSKIFDHLFTTKAVGKGTGLGLAIARQIVVEKHNGRLEVQSKLGQGTEFSISLPVRG